MDAESRQVIDFSSQRPQRASSFVTLDSLDTDASINLVNQSLTNRQKRYGRCIVCKRLLSLTLTGLIHQHGPGCSGTGLLPVDGSITLSKPNIFSSSQSSNTTQNKAQAAIPHEDPSDATQQLLDILISQKCRLLKRIPKASRNLAANVLSTLLNEIVSNPVNFKAWKNLLLFSYSCFAVPGQRGGKRHASSLATKVNKALNSFPDNITSKVPTRQSTLKNNHVYNISARVSEKIEEGDLRGAIRLASSDETMASYSEATVTSLRLIHPPRTSYSTVFPLHSQTDHSINVLTLQEKDIIIAIRSFAAGSAGGPDGLRPQHLKDLTSQDTGESGQRLITSIMNFSNLCLTGAVPASIRPIFCGASLCALNKKGGGIRPIAVGCTFRRLIAKAAGKSVEKRMSSWLAPLQLGYGVHCGSEAAAHASRTFINNMNPGTGKAFLKLDFRNAFNSLSRDVILQVFSEELPELYPFINMCYDSQSTLIFGEHTISSDEGLQQGDPFGSLGFCASIHKRLVMKIKSELNLWFLDDGSLGGDVDVLLEDYLFINTEGKNMGLTLNESKCELITDDLEILSKFRSVAPNIAHKFSSTSTLLGAPIGNDDGIDDFLLVKLADFQRLIERLKSLDAHDAFFLLKNCFSLPKLLYTLRCSPAYRISQRLTEYDDAIRSSLQSILNIVLSDDSWNQATLPISEGGLGVRKASDIALPAFLSSISGSNALILEILPEGLHSIAGTNDASFVSATDEWKRLSSSSIPDLSISKKQKSWDKPLIAVAVERVKSSASTQAGIARLLAVASPQAGAFLHAYPCSSTGTRLDNSSLRIAIALRLGATICAPHSCICGAEVDASGIHGLCCKKSAGAVNDLIKRALASAEIPSRLEPSSLSRDDGKRPDGLSTMPWKEGRCLIWDFTCPDTLAPSHLNLAVTGSSRVADDAEDRKCSKYSSLSTKFYFVPIAVETFGAVGIQAFSFFKDLGKRLMTVTKENRSFSFLMQRISVAIQRGNAACILGTTKDQTSLDELFYI